MLRLKKYVLWWIAYVGTVLALTFLVLATLSGIGTDYGCKDTFATEARSPDGAWKAQVNESLCENTVVMDITAGVYLVSAADSAEYAELLSVDTGGRHEERPRIAWTAPDVLQVTVPNISFLNVLTRRFHGVRIDLRYDPDDPAARAAWRQKLGEPPDLDDPK